MVIFDFFFFNYWFHFGYFKIQEVSRSLILREKSLLCTYHKILFVALLSFGFEWKWIFWAFSFNIEEPYLTNLHTVIFPQTVPFFLLTHYRPVIMCVPGFFGWKPDDNPAVFKDWCSIVQFLSSQRLLPCACWFIDKGLCGAGPQCRILIGKWGALPA